MTNPTMANGVCPMLHAFKDDSCIEEQASESLGVGQE
jgi:hypothetical protein